MNCKTCELLTDDDFIEKQLILGRLNGLFFAFYNKEPITPGHIIIAPVRHVDDILDLNENELKKLMPFIKKVYEALNDTMSPEKIYICSFNESENMHLHFHLIPKQEDELPFKEKYGDWGNKGPVLYFMLSTFKDWEIMEKFSGKKDEYSKQKLKEGRRTIKKLRRILKEE